MTGAATLDRNTRAVERGVPALSVAHLTGPAGEAVIHDVGFAIGAGETHVIFGPIHSGKSLVMRHILGLERAESGVISVSGESFDAANPVESVMRGIRRHIGVVFEGSALLSRLSVVQNVELPLLEHHEATAEEARESAHKLLRDVGVIVDDETLPGQIGRAEQRRVALARALALEPSLMLLDEPSHGLDSHAAGELDALIAQLQRRHGFALLIASHEGRYAFSRGARIHVMVDGAIVASGDYETVRASGHPIVRHMLERRGGR